MGSGKVVFGWVPMPFGGFSVVQMGFFESFFGFCAFDSGSEGRQIFGGYTYVGTGYIPASRNGVAKTFLDKTDGDWLLMLDWDVGWDPMAVYQLLDAADPDTKPIVTGCYVTYFGEGSVLRPCWMEEKGGEEYVPVDSFEVGRLTPLTVAGMGFTLIHRGVFERIAADERWAEDPWTFFGHDIIGADRTGEDLTFCSRARATGSTVWGHGGVLLQHTKAKTLTPLDMGDGPFGTSQRGRHFPQVVGDVPIPEPAPRPRLLNVGGGSKAIPVPEHFAAHEHVLLDIAAGPDVDVIMDARDLGRVRSVHQTFPDPSDIEVQLAGGFDAVYSSHNLEHYHTHEVGGVLKGMLHVLKPGGMVDIRCPNVDGLIRQYVESGADLGDVAYESGAGPITYSDVLYGFGREVESGNPYYAHKTGFTKGLLEEAMVGAGFVNVKVVAVELELVGMGQKDPGGPIE